MKKKIIIAAIAVTALLAVTLIAYIIWGNSALILTELAVTDSKLPDAFDGYRIVQISDLHCAEFGSDNQRLIDMVSAASPDIIIITGDLIDYRHGEESVGIDFAAKAVNIAPTYFVSGNHENDCFDFANISKKLQSVGVTVLRNESIPLLMDNESITLVGIDDPVFLRKSPTQDFFKAADEALEKLAPSDDTFTILLSHRPEFIELYAKYGFNLVFSGHAHGGQFILPLIGGLYAPGQGLLPKYTSGLYTYGKTRMAVSRGLGNSGFPFRFNNRPEIILLTLNAE